MNVRILAAVDRCIRPILAEIVPPSILVKTYSAGRKKFISKLASEAPTDRIIPEKRLEKICWGITFRSPIFNAAGMFKNGEGYSLVSAQGAGAYIAGTTTFNSRPGNTKDGIHLPFSPYPRSGAASNWLGLPNDGDSVVAKRLQSISRVPGCPIGVSVMGSPDYSGDEKLEKLISGMLLYRDAGVDFIEINESCPNTAHGKPQDDDLSKRLEKISAEFIATQATGKRTPVIVKFSNDTEPEQVPALMDLLFSLGFDGVNFGNSSVTYAKHAKYIAGQEQQLYKFFTTTFGGGVTGRPLRDTSLELVRKASESLRRNPPKQEFHIIRTGGIESAADIKASLEAGASLVQWYTAYFENFARVGHSVYKELYQSI